MSLETRWPDGQICYFDEVNVSLFISNASKFQCLSYTANNASALQRQAS
jgi:hypothetical protein